MAEGKDPYLHIPDLNTTEFGGETRYYFNEKFGYRSIISKTEMQLKSKGTWLAAIKYHYSKIEKPSNNYFVLNDKSYHLNVIGGYAYNIILPNNFFVFGQFTPSLGLKHVTNIHNKPDGGTEINRYLIPNYGLRTRLEIGYNSNKFYYGASMLVNATSYSEYANMDLVDTRIYASIYLGYRFKASKGLENLFKKLGL